MFERITPESAGVSARAIIKYISFLENRGATPHGFLMTRGGKIFTEHYYAPFHKEFCHRMYSQTKSFVSIAIGLLEEEGKLCLDDPISKYFPERIEGELPEFLAKQTIREMLTMTTCMRNEFNWFTAGDPDRTHLYFAKNDAKHPAGGIWQYDSQGSQVLSSLAEKLAGCPLLDYLKKKIFNHTGGFETAEMLKTPNGETWGDSAMLCTLRDMAVFGNFVMHYGTWQGKRLMNEAYLRTATSAVVQNNVDGYRSVFRYGYGYQIWRCEQNGFAFVGMGNQLTVCLPDRDFLFTTTSDDQGNEFARELLINALFDIVVADMKDVPLPEDEEANRELAEISSGLKLRAISGIPAPDFAKELDGKVYECEENPTGISSFSFRFTKDGGELHYTNEQGDKVLPFCLNQNCFTNFPEYGYSNDFGSLRTADGFTYRAAVSAAWQEERKIMLRVQIIDRYFGTMTAVFAFKDHVAQVRMVKTAEDFLGKYQGNFIAYRK